MTHIRKEIYCLLISCGLFLEKQRGCLKGTRETGELLYIDQDILKKNKTRRKNLAMMSIDYRKAHYKVPQSK